MTGEQDASVVATNPEIHDHEGAPAAEPTTLAPRTASWPWAMVQSGIAVLACAALLPLFGVLYALVRLDSAGPFLVRQRRRGFRGVAFDVLEVRTRTIGGEPRPALGIAGERGSVTRVGHLLRALKLDRLPQLWNVVCGDMELVGPRPIPMDLEDDLRRHIPGFHNRGCVKPGLANASPVSIGDDEPAGRLVHDWSLRFEGELHYIRNKSFAYDVVVIAVTSLFAIRKVVRRVLWGMATKTEAEPCSATGPAVPVTMVTGIPVCNLDRAAIVDRVATWVAERSHRYMCICTVRNIVTAHMNDEHRLSLMNADLNTSSGMPIAWTRKLFGDRRATRVCGPTLVIETLERAEREEWRVALCCGSPERLEVLVEEIRERFPQLPVVEAVSPPPHELTLEENRVYVERLRTAEPDVIFVGLRGRKQERWMRENSPAIPGVFVGIGGAFDLHSGADREAPAFLGKHGLEWSFRLWCGLRRLMARDVSTNPLYAALVMKQFVFSLFSRQRALMEIPERTALSTAVEDAPARRAAPARKAA